LIDTRRQGLVLAGKHLIEERHIGEIEDKEFRMIDTRYTRSSKGLKLQATLKEKKGN
jgi:hypothetical protein